MQMALSRKKFALQQQADPCCYHHQVPLRQPPPPAVAGDKPVAKWEVQEVDAWDWQLPRGQHLNAAAAVDGWGDDGCVVVAVQLGCVELLPQLLQRLGGVVWMLWRIACSAKPVSARPAGCWG